MNSFNVWRHISVFLIPLLLFAILLCHFVPVVSATEIVTFEGTGFPTYGVWNFGGFDLPGNPFYLEEYGQICVVVYWETINVYELCVGDSLYYEYDVDGDYCFGLTGLSHISKYQNGEWKAFYENPYGNLISAVGNSDFVVWTNTNILYKDGSIGNLAVQPVFVSNVDSFVTSVSVSSLTSSAYPGSTVHFDAAVSGTGSYDSSVTWSVIGAASANTSIDSSGNLTIADNETAAQLTIRATSVQDTSVFGSASIVVLPFPNVDELTIVPGKETALQGVAFVQQFSLVYKDGTAYTGPSPVWSFEVTPPDSPFPDLDGEYSWVTISDTGILSISADAPADYMVVLTAKLGDQYLTGGRVFISTETNDYLKDIINGTEEQKGQADSFGDKTDEQFADLEEDVSFIDQVTMPNIDDIDLNIDTQVSGDGMTALAMLLGLFMNSQVISTSMTFAFLFALVAFVIFGKR